jgi:hypothetical protein
MAAGSREAPTTATERGRKKGRSEAAVAARPPVSVRAACVGGSTAGSSDS